MIIRAIAVIDLKLDGTWKIMQMYSAKPDDIRPDDMIQPMSDEEKERKLDYICNPPKDPEATPVQDLLDHAQAVREKRKHMWPIRHSHCNICGACGKKRTTHRVARDGHHYHTGEPFSGVRCHK